MRRLCVLVPMLAALALTSAAAMADGLNLNWREARVVKLAKPATSIVVGDPTVADVTLDTPDTMIIFGKTPGETNLLVLSSNQELLLDWPVVVSPVTARHVSVLNAAGGGAEAPTEVLYACGTERCARVLSPTDVQFQSTASSSTTSDTDASKTAASTETTVGSSVNQSGPAAATTGTGQ